MNVTNNNNPTFKGYYYGIKKAANGALQKTSPVSSCTHGDRIFIKKLLNLMENKENMKGIDISLKKSSVKNEGNSTLAVEIKPEVYNQAFPNILSQTAKSLEYSLRSFSHDFLGIMSNRNTKKFVYELPKEHLDHLHNTVTFFSSKNKTLAGKLEQKLKETQVKPEEQQWLKDFFSVKKEERVL